MIKIIIAFFITISIQIFVMTLLIKESTASSLIGILFFWSSVFIDMFIFMNLEKIGNWLKEGWIQARNISDKIINKWE
jgi:hypothetical protein